MAKVNLTLCGLKLRNPLMLAAGILGVTSYSLLEVSRAGAGAVVTKSIGLNPKEGHSGPNIVELPYGLLNAMGLPNPGCQAFSMEIKEYKKFQKNVPLIGSIFGSTPEEYAKTAEIIGGAGVDALELNISCPHATEEIGKIGHSPEATKKVVEAVKHNTKVPIFVKLPGNTNIQNLLDVAIAAEQVGADAVVAINTLPGMAVNIETRRPILGNLFGGLSGPAVKPVGIRLIYELFQTIKIPIIGVGGITTWKDALEYIMVGASAIQIGTAIAKRDLQVYKQINARLEEYLESEGIDDISKLVGCVT